MTGRQVSVVVDAPAASVGIEAYLDITTGDVSPEPVENAAVTVCLDYVLPMPSVDEAEAHAVGVTFLRGERGPKGDPGPKGEPGTASVEALTKTDILKLF